MQSDFHLKVNNQGLVCFGFICNCPTIKRHIIYCANTLAALIFLKKKGRERAAITTVESAGRDASVGISRIIA